MGLLKVAGAIALFLVLAAWLKANDVINLYAPVADVAARAADMMLRVASWARGQA